MSLAVLFTTSMLSFAADAAQKIALVDVQRVLSAMPQVATIEQDINAEFAEQIQEVQKLRSDGSFLLQKLEREEATMSQAQIQETQQEIKTIGETLQAKGQPLQQNMQRRTQEERNKLLKHIKDAIDEIAAEEDFDLILNATAVPFNKPEYDISEAVLNKVSKIK